MQGTEILEKLKSVELDAGIVFSGQPTGTRVKGYDKPNPFTPKINPNYIFHETSRDVIGLIAPPSPLYVCGVSGAGKSSLINQLAARLNYPVFEVTGHNRLEFQDMVGHHTVQKGNMKFEYGPLALAMKYGGLFLLNELDLLEPSTATDLNGILDGQPLCIPENGGELIEPHPMFRFAATANTNGASDETGLYQGTLRMNMALMDRFTVIEVTYPKPEAELQILEKMASALPAKIRSKMVEYANEVRRLFMGESGNDYNAIEVTFTTRTLLRWADLTIRYQPLAKQGIQPISYVLDRALGFRAGRETRAVLHELAQRIFSLENVSESNSDEMNFIGKNDEPSSKKNNKGFVTKLIVQGLADLVMEAHNHPSALSFEPQISLHCDIASGGKFWRCQAQSDKINITWGKCGTSWMSKIIPLDQCVQNNSVLELRTRSLDKISKGYELVPNETKPP